MSFSSQLEALAGRIREGHKPSIARALNLLEDRRQSRRALLGQLLGALGESGPGPFAEASLRIGLTGPPGVGKSTLAAALGRALRSAGRRVAVVAIDPTSVRSGGSLLGDRARMAFDPKDNGLFARSYATGGEAGGLSWATQGAVRLLECAYERVLVETTGVGQTETAIRDIADLVVLVIQPGSGDALQFLKAGIMEIPDLLVVNKADQGALADRAVSDLKAALASGQAAGVGRAIPILAVSAQSGLGIDALVEAIEAQAAPNPALRRRGSIHWTRQLLRQRHGSHGEQCLEGLFGNLDAHIDGALDNEAPPSISARLGEHYLQHLRATKP